MVKAHNHESTIHILRKGFIWYAYNFLATWTRIPEKTINNMFLGKQNVYLLYTYLQKKISVHLLALADIMYMYIHCRYKSYFQFRREMQLRLNTVIHNKGKERKGGEVKHESMQVCRISWTLVYADVNFNDVNIRQQWSPGAVFYKLT